MNISVEKLYEFLDSTTFLYQGDILELLDNIKGIGKPRVIWHGEIYDLSADTESED